MGTMMLLVLLAGFVVCGLSFGLVKPSMAIYDRKKGTALWKFQYRFMIVLTLCVGMFGLFLICFYITFH